MKKVNFNRTFLILINFFIFAFSTNIIACSSNDNKNDNKIYNDKEVLDKKILELEDMKKGYEAKAIKHANKAERLQFVEGQLQVAKKHWKLADENKKIADEIQKQIDELQVRKLKINKK